MSSATLKRGGAPRRAGRRASAGDAASGRSTLSTLEVPRGAALGEYLTYPVEPPVLDWCVRNVRLPSDKEVFERFDPALTPWVPSVLDWMVDDLVEIVFLVQGSQTSKTSSMMLGALWLMHHRPGNAAWIAATEDEARSFVTDRLQPIIAASGWRPPAKHDWRDDAFMAGRSMMRTLWASSALKLRSWSYRYIFGDECGAWPETLRLVGEPVAYSQKRMRLWRGRGGKGVYGTTPGTPNTPAWKHARRAAWHRWLVPCPHCGVFQYLAWGRIVFDHCRRPDKTWDLSRVRRETHYVCGDCGSVIEERRKLSMLQAGRLVRVDPDSGEPVEGAPPAREVTLQVPATYSVFTTWGELAVMFIKATDDGPEALRIFVTDELAEPWVEHGDAPTVDVIEACIDRDRPRGVVPEEALAMTAGVDVQKEHLVYVVRAWGPQWRSWLVAQGWLPYDGKDLSLLDEVVLASWGGRMIDMSFIDSRYRPAEVKAYCLGSPERLSRVAPSEGMPGDRSYLVKPVPMLLDRRGRPMAHGPKRYALNTAAAMQWVHAHMRVQAGDPGEWRLHSEIEQDPRYCAQLVNSVRREVMSRGSKVWKWQMVNSGVGRDYHHAESYAYCAAFYPVAVQRLSGHQRSGRIKLSDRQKGTR